MTLSRTSFAPPAELLAWLDAEAKARGRSRNSLMTHLLEQARDSDLLRRLERLEAQVKKLSAD